MKIIIQHHPVPMPYRRFDYSAFEASYEPGDIVGYGSTAEEARADLLEQMGGTE